MVQALGQNFRFARRGNRLDMLLGDLPEYAADEYERHGVFTGQLVYGPDFIQGTILGLDFEGGAWVRPTYQPNVLLNHPISQLNPRLVSQQIREAPDLWAAFSSYAEDRATQTQAAMGGALGPQQIAAVKTKNLASWMEDFFDAAGINNPADRDRIRPYFNQQWVEGFKAEAPTEAAFQTAVVATPTEMPVREGLGSLDRRAAGKGFIVVPENESTWHVVDTVQKPEPPARPSTGGGPPGGTVRTPAATVTFPSQEAAETWVRELNRELPDITPPSEVPLEVAAIHPTEPTQEPNLNHVVEQNTVDSILEMAADSDGGADIPPQALAASGNSGRLNNRWVQQFLRWRPARRLWSALDQGLSEHLGFESGVARDYERLSHQLVMHHNDQNPWMDRLADILKPVRTKFLRDGTWTRTYEILDPTERARVIARLGLTPREAASFDQFDRLMQDLFPETGLDQIRQIPRYISHLSVRQSQPEMVGRVFEDFPLGPTTQPFYEYARTQNLNFRELHPGTLGETYIRAVTWKKNMAPLWDELSERANAMSQHSDPAISQVGAIFQQQLRLVKFGYQAADDTAVDAAHGALQLLLGPEVTRQQAREIFNFGMNSIHAGMLGFRPSVIARDTLQAFLAIPRAGRELLNVYAQWMSSPGARKAIWDTAVREGAVSLQMPRSACGRSANLC